jgi:hypothetical protein
MSVVWVLPAYLQDTVLRIAIREAKSVATCGANMMDLKEHVLINPGDNRSEWIQSQGLLSGGVLVAYLESMVSGGNKRLTPEGPKFSIFILSHHGLFYQ